MDVVVEIPEAAWQRNWVGRAIIIKTHMHRIKNVLHIFSIFTHPLKYLESSILHIL